MRWKEAAFRLLTTLPVTTHLREESMQRRQGQRLSDEENAEIGRRVRKLRNHKVSANEIARRLGVALRTVQHHLKVEA